jgi:hypothetical protein
VLEVKRVVERFCQARRTTFERFCRRSSSGGPFQTGTDQLLHLGREEHIAVARPPPESVGLGLGLRRDEVAHDVLRCRCGHVAGAV